MRELVVAPRMRDPVAAVVRLAVVRVVAARPAVALGLVVAVAGVALSSAV